MKKLITLPLVACLAACNPGSLVGGIGAVDNALVRVAGGYELPAACAIIRVADGYYLNVRGKVTQAARVREAQAMAVVNAICNDPPKDLVSAFGTLMKAWTDIQAATTVPGA